MFSFNGARIAQGLLSRPHSRQHAQTAYQCCPTLSALQKLCFLHFQCYSDGVEALVHCQVQQCIQEVLGHADTTGAVKSNMGWKSVTGSHGSSSASGTTGCLHLVSISTRVQLGCTEESSVSGVDDSQVLSTVKFVSAENLTVLTIFREGVLDPWELVIIQARMARPL